MKLTRKDEAVDEYEQGLTDIAASMRKKDRCILNAGTAAFILRARDRMKWLESELLHVHKKSQHGCYDFTCPVCDAGK